jgi:putative transposase
MSLARVRPRPHLTFPAARTTGMLFQGAGLSQSHTRRRRHRHPGAIPLQAEASTAVWTADFKGQFRPSDGLHCSVLTVADAYSRFLLSCSARLSTKHVEAWPIFKRLFQEYGLPEAIHTNNGAPFATPTVCGLSKLSGWWIRLGIPSQHIARRDRR